MKGVGRLIQNELIKVFRQLSWKIITVIILVLALLSPLFSTLFDSATSGINVDYQQLYENAPEGSIEREYYGVYADAYSFFADNGISADDWRYETYYNDYEDLLITVRALELVKNGENPDEVFEWFWWDEITVDYIDGNMVIQYFDGITGETSDITAQLASEKYEEEKDLLDSMSEEIKTVTVESYASGFIESLKSQVAEKEEKYTEVKAAYEKDNSKIFDYQSTAYDLYAVKTSLAIWEIIKNAAREDEAWLLDTGRKTFYYTEYGSQVAIVDRETFDKDSSYLENYSSYESYVEMMDKQFHDRIAALDILRYSAENKIPLPDAYPDSVRATVSDSVISNASLVLFFCMILAATIVSSEHMSGSIRLLVIRPRARWKILLSKLICVVIYGLLMFVASSFVSMITTFIVSGTGDLAIPFLIYRYGAVKEISPVIYILAKTLVSSLPNLLVISLAFLLSVVVKKVMFALAIPMMISMFGAIASTITMLFYTEVPFLGWTLIPYFVIDSYTVDVVTRTSNYYSFDFVSMGLELEHGVILFLLHIALFVAISFLVFRRQEIKN